MRTGRAMLGPGREAAGRRLRQRGPAPADRRLRGARAARARRSRPYDKASIKAIEKAHPDERPRHQPVERRRRSSGCVPGAHRGASQGAGEGGAHPGRGGSGGGAQHPPPGPPRARGLEKDGELSKDDLERAEKDLEKRTHDVIAEIDELLKHKETRAPRGVSKEATGPAAEPPEQPGAALVHVPLDRAIGLAGEAPMARTCEDQSLPRRPAREGVPHPRARTRRRRRSRPARAPYAEEPPRSAPRSAARRAAGGPVPTPRRSGLTELDVPAGPTSARRRPDRVGRSTARRAADAAAALDRAAHRRGPHDAGEHA